MKSKWIKVRSAYRTCMAQHNLVTTIHPVCHTATIERTAIVHLQFKPKCPPCWLLKNGTKSHIYNPVITGLNDPFFL